MLKDEELETLHDFGQFPVYMGCTDKDIELDHFRRLSFSIGKQSGIIQLDAPAPLDLVYPEQHNDGTGKMWERHYKEFAYFISKYNGSKYFEIGSSHDKIAKIVMELKNVNQWIMLEPNPIVKETENITIIKKWFDENIKISSDIDIVLHSHVLEHLYEPNNFLLNLSKQINENQIHIFSLPNMEKWLDSKFLNCLNFEHTVFLSENILDYLLYVNNMEILEKYYYKDHSIFYATKKSKNAKKITLENSYIKNKKMFEDLFNDNFAFVKKCNEIINNTNSNVYIFGAHVFTQYLLNFGLNSEKINGIIDQSKLKIGKRLYGTSLNVYDPDILKNQKSPIVILRAGVYNDSIMNSLYDINKELLFLS